MTKVQCSRTGIAVDPSDAIWDDGEWLSWEWISSQIDPEPDTDLDHGVEVEPESSEPLDDRFVSREGFPFSVLEHTDQFHELIDLAQRYFENTGRYLQIWGELGEMYAEIYHGLRRHRSLHPGSDGMIGGARVEVKTISPEKSRATVRVKRSGDFEKLLVVRIDSSFDFQSVLIDRSRLTAGSGPYYRAGFKQPD